MQLIDVSSFKLIYITRFHPVLALLCTLVLENVMYEVLQMFLHKFLSYNVKLLFVYCFESKHTLKM